VELTLYSVVVDPSGRKTAVVRASTSRPRHRTTSRQSSASQIYAHPKDTILEGLTDKPTSVCSLLSRHPGNPLVSILWKDITGSHAQRSTCISYAVGKPLPLRIVALCLGMAVIAACLCVYRRNLRPNSLDADGVLCMCHRVV
jgi:hypothetical protein